MKPVVAAIVGAFAGFYLGYAVFERWNDSQPIYPFIAVKPDDRRIQEAINAFNQAQLRVELAGAFAGGLLALAGFLWVRRSKG